MKNVYENVICAGVDVHHKFSSVTFRDGRGSVVRRERLDHVDRRKLREKLQRWPKGMPVVLEASFGWAWLSDEMVRAGLHPRLSNCFKVERMREARGSVKTNKKDADLLSMLPSELTNWWEVWMAPPEVRDRRERMRYRADLVTAQTQTKNRIHAVLQRHGIFHEFSDLFGAHGRVFLVALCRDGAGRLGERALSVLQGLVRLWKHIRAELATVTCQLRQELDVTPEVGPLMTIPGIGLILAHILRAEIGEMDRFRGTKALASYALLAPLADETGEADPTQSPLGRRLGHRGNTTLQWALLEAARGAVRSGGRWREMFDRYTNGGKNHRNRGYIKVARELVPVVRRVWLDNQPYTDTPPARPGSRRHGRRARATRSGTGQPSVAMVKPR